MKRIATILVPVDFGQASDHALAYAMDLAEQLGAGVHVITAYEMPVASFPDGVWAASPEIVTKLIDATQTALDRTVEPYRGRKAPLTAKLVQGDPRDAILETAQTAKADLIVMGTHGRRGIARALIGSVAESVLRAAEVPVLTIR